MRGGWGWPAEGIGIGSELVVVMIISESVIAWELRGDPTVLVCGCSRKQRCSCQRNI